MFGLLTEEDEEIANENCGRSNARLMLDSSLTTKVANGAVRRTAPLIGAYYVEVRVYNTAEALKSRPDERYKKALVTLKAQLNVETQEWRDLQKFIKKTKTLFNETEPVFYSNKIHFK